ncbi:MAG: hypothetical protein K8H88_06425, partial [Sandaracinaceae bacterium]|nr:hypothetical protein [Sandaracinaceae bacterium]
MSEELTEETPSLRPSLRPIGFAVVANLLLAGLVLGVPYLRGRARAEESRERFAEFAGCFFAAQARSGGLALPRGERARYGTLAL